MEKNAVRSTVNLFVEHGEAVDAAIRRGVRDALLMHKRAGNPVAVWQDGKVVLLQPDEILPETNEIQMSYEQRKR